MQHPREALEEEMDYPATVVEVRVPKVAQPLLLRPFEVAHLEGESFAAAGIRLVYGLSESKRRRKISLSSHPSQSWEGTREGKALRILAVYI